VHKKLDELPQLKYNFYATAGSGAFAASNISGGAPTYHGPISGTVSTAPINSPNGGFTTISTNIQPNVSLKSPNVAPGLNFIKPAPKTDVLYIIVARDGATLEFSPTSPITPREMINICIFFNVVTGVIVTALGGAAMGIKWSDLIRSLQIDNHFTPGKVESFYDSSGDVLHVLLKDTA